MKRRDFILGLGGAALCLNAARGQQNPPITQHSTTKKRIAQVVPSTKVDEMKADPVTKPFFDELKRLGYVEGENLIVERYSGEGRLERYDSLAHEVVDTKPDLIWAAGTPLTLRLKAATNTIPIVTITGDPIRFGIVSNIARPGATSRASALMLELKSGVSALRCLPKLSPSSSTSSISRPDRILMVLEPERRKRRQKN